MNYKLISDEKINKERKEAKDLLRKAESSNDEYWKGHAFGVISTLNMIERINNQQ